MWIYSFIDTLFLCCHINSSQAYGTILTHQRLHGSLLRIVGNVFLLKKTHLLQFGHVPIVSEMVFSILLFVEETTQNTS